MDSELTKAKVRVKDAWEAWKEAMIYAWTNEADEAEKIAWREVEAAEKARSEIVEK